MKRLLILVLMFLFAATLRAEKIGEVSTRFKLLGPNDKVMVEVFDDPDVPGVACYISRAKTGGITGAVGIAEDTSDASISCRQIGPVTLSAEVMKQREEGVEVFKARSSILFKTMQVVRFYDPKRNVLVYLTYSDKLIEGSPKNSISVVPVLPWPVSQIPQTQ